MKKQILFLIASTLALVGCANKPKSVFEVDPNWTQKPEKIIILFADPMVSNTDDLEDDLKEYSDSFDSWFGAEIKKNMELVTRNSVDIDVRNIDSAEVSFDSDSLKGVAVNIPKAAMEGNGIYLVLGNVMFSRNEETYANHAYYQSGAAYGAQVDPGKNSMASAGATFTEQGLWIHADYAFYNAATKERVAFGHWEIKSKFTYAMTRGDWEKCVLALTKKMLARTPVLKK